MEEQSNLNGASEPAAHRKHVRVKPHMKRGRMVGLLAKATKINPKRIRDTLRANGYDYPWEDEERARAILAKAGLLKSGKASNRAKTNGSSPAGRKTNYPERSPTPPEIAREVRMNDKTLYGWLHKAGYEPPWDDRRRVLEIIVARAVRKKPVQKRAQALLAELDGGPSERIAASDVAPSAAHETPSPVNNRVLEALVYLRQAEQAIFADIRAKRIKTLTGHRGYRRALEAKAVLEGETD